MNIIIIGGGVAGLATAYQLKTFGFNVKIAEKRSSYAQEEGHGFAILPNGLEALEQAGLLDDVLEHGLSLDRIIIRNPENKIIRAKELFNHLSIQRSKLLNLFRNKLSNEILNNHEFDYFSKSNNHFKLANFKNGKSYSADLFIASDGAMSNIRANYFSQPKTGNIRIKEFITTVYQPDIAKSIGRNFIKTVSKDGGEACGVLGVGDGKVIWFYQYDSYKYNIESNNPEELRKFIFSRIGHWPYPIADLLESTDFNNVFHWFTSEFLMPLDLYKSNLILLGDACHLFLTLTSQGANCALNDGTTLAHCLAYFSQWTPNNIINNSLPMYQALRSEVYKEYIKEGKNLANQFLNIPKSNPRIPLTVI